MQPLLPNESHELPGREVLIAPVDTNVDPASSICQNLLRQRDFITAVVHITRNPPMPGGTEPNDFRVVMTRLLELVTQFDGTYLSQFIRAAFAHYIYFMCSPTQFQLFLGQLKHSYAASWKIEQAYARQLLHMITMLHGAYVYREQHICRGRERPDFRVADALTTDPVTLSALQPFRVDRF